MEISIGRMQMSLDQFWDSEPREIMLAINGWSKQRRDEMRMLAEQFRRVAFFVAAPYSKKGMDTPSDLYRFSWDPDDGKKVRVTAEEFKKITQSWDDSMRGPDGKFR